MDSKKKYPSDRHKNSTTFTVRIDDYLLALYDAKRELEGKSRRALVIEWIEDYCFGKED